MIKVMLITGGAGYVGSHLAKELLNRKEEVRIFDIQPTKYLPEGAEFIQGDMRNMDEVHAALEGVDTVFHLAFVQSMSKRPEREKWDINVNGTENFLKASVDEGIRRFVHTSTIEIYGSHPPYPCTEDAPTDKPTGWYGRHKLECEKILWRYHKEHGIDAVALRMPTICGPGFYAHRPLLYMFDRVIDGKWILVAGDGQIKGDFVWIGDVIQAYLLAAKRKEAVGQAFDISCDKSSTQLELMQALKEAVGSRSKIRKIPRPFVKLTLYVSRILRMTDLPRDQFGYTFNNCVYSVEKAKKLLGYKPMKSAAEAAAELIKAYKEDRKFLREKAWNY